MLVRDASSADTMKGRCFSRATVAVRTSCSRTQPRSLAYLRWTCNCEVLAEMTTPCTPHSAAMRTWSGTAWQKASVRACNPMAAI